MTLSIKKIPQKLIMENSTMGEVKYVLVSLDPRDKGRIMGLGVKAKKGTLPFKYVDGLHVVPVGLLSITKKGYTIKYNAYRIMIARRSRYKKTY